MKTSAWTMNVVRPDLGQFIDLTGKRSFLGVIIDLMGQMMLYMLGVSLSSEFFVSWMKVFLRHCVRTGQLFSGMPATLEVIDLAWKNDVILFCLSPHTTHALQPLDVSVFKSLKSHFSKAVHALSFAKKDFVISKRCLPGL